MSTMLEQAIIDAETLRETALKNAEAQVIEKYSDEILDGTPPAAHEGEKLCPCPDQGDVVTIDLDDMANKLTDKDDELEAHDVVGSQITNPESDDRYGEELRYRLGSLEDKLSNLLGDMEQPGRTASAANVYQESMDDEIDIDSLIEKLTVDIEPKLGGWAGRPEKDLDVSEQELVASLQDDEKKEDHEALAAAVKKLEEANLSLTSNNSILNERNEKLETISIQLRDRLVESNLSNARLLYTNKVLGSNSLNGRQKTKIVEAISKAESVEEAKTIFETLQSAVGPAKHTRPQSLSEAVNRNSSTILPRARKNSPKNPEMNRWKALAGITADKKD